MTVQRLINELQDVEGVWRPIHIKIGNKKYEVKKVNGNIIVVKEARE